jgi:hypothetical protein
MQVLLQLQHLQQEKKQKIKSNLHLKNNFLINKLINNNGSKFFAI